MEVVLLGATNSRFLCLIVENEYGCFVETRQLFVQYRDIC
jgi:hypothetical protein